MLCVRWFAILLVFCCNIIITIEYFFWTSKDLFLFNHTEGMIRMIGSDVYAMCRKIFVCWECFQNQHDLAHRIRWIRCNKPSNYQLTYSNMDYIYMYTYTYLQWTELKGSSRNGPVNGGERPNPVLPFTLESWLINVNKGNHALLWPNYSG